MAAPMWEMERQNSTSITESRAPQQLRPLGAGLSSATAPAPRGDAVAGTRVAPSVEFSISEVAGDLRSKAADVHKCGKNFWGHPLFLFLWDGTPLNPLGTKLLQTGVQAKQVKCFLSYFSTPPSSVLLLHRVGCSPQPSAPSELFSSVCSYRWFPLFL